MATLTFEEARRTVIEKMLGSRRAPLIEQVPLEDAAGRVLAEEIHADRDYPPRDRSVRDGFAVRASGLPGTFRVIGEVRAGQKFEGAVGDGEAIEIMTGALLPEGADAVVMVEHTARQGDRMSTEHSGAPGLHVARQASEATRGETLLHPGRRLGFAEISMLATVGKTQTAVYLRPPVAILATGDEILEVGDKPLDHQIRNSNAHSLAEQVRRAGGHANILPVARDNFESTKTWIEAGLEHDLLLISGGVSAGKYDVVESVLAACGAEFYFDRVLIQPGQPLVFGRAASTFFFGLPGNPASTMVTFEIFARAAVEILGGQTEVALPMFACRLTKDFRHKTGLTRFLPASLSADGTEVTPLGWQGSSDVPSLVRANAFLVAESGRESWSAGESIRVLPK